MVNRTLFGSSKTADNNALLLTRNAAGGKAYRMTDEHALAQYAFTGTLSNAFYISAETQLSQVLELCSRCTPEYVAKVAIAARQDGYMKDMPAMLAAYLHAKEPKLLARIFDRVIDNGKMLRNFMQIVRSGATGRRGLGATTKNIIRKWLNNRTDVQLLYDSVGGGNKTHDVSLEHVVRMVRPKPKSTSRSALYAWLRGAKIDGDKLIQATRFRIGKDEQGSPIFRDGVREYSLSDLPDRIQTWESYKRNPQGTPPKVPFQMLTSLKLSTEDWETIARNMSWQEIRQNLETLQRHGVFDSPAMVNYVCRRLSDPEEIASAKVFPFQLLAAYLNTGEIPTGYGWSANYWQTVSKFSDDGKKTAVNSSIPKEVRLALESAMELAVKHVPALRGKVFVCPDTSGSMGYPVTGSRSAFGRPASKVRCVDVAGLVTAAILRNNPSAAALPFSTKVHDVELNPMDSVMRNASKFVAMGGGGTSCSEPLRVLNSLNAKGDVVIFISDYESWIDRSPSGVAMMEQWKRFKDRNPQAKLICIDVTPKTNAQVVEDDDILSVGGFSDNVFKMMKRFVDGNMSRNHWVDEIHKIVI